ncbi:nucleoside hydrolase [Nocardioides sp. GY 10113]|uniref:nucleoside hydrolase n=1 Tax=Nocardioides sp. GY 10113 TaxID=2569761 RepID=UPI001458BBDC|nr:nucleoside hydrolase [Nocardioides sp. GY 10113]
MNATRGVRWLAALGLAVAAATTGCTAATDDDGELGALAAAPARRPDALPIVVDSDFAPDDLLALAYLLRHPGVRVVAVTVPATGMVTCPRAGDLLARLAVAVEIADPVQIACGRRSRVPHGLEWPAEWVRAAENPPLAAVPAGVRPPVWAAGTDPATLMLRLARAHEGLQVVALGPATELATALRRDPVGYGRIARIVAMTGAYEGPSQSPGAAEWNAAADPDALAGILAGPVPVTAVPDEAIPRDLLEPLADRMGMLAPLVDAAGTVHWDVVTAALVTDPKAASTVRGSWSVDVSEDRGRLSRRGPGVSEVVTGVDEDVLLAPIRTTIADG